MDMPAEIDMGLEKLEATIKIAELDPHIFRIFGLNGNLGGLV
jgi:phage tail tube protein FII